jgi:ATP-dependent DNA helicase RecQ
VAPLECEPGYALAAYGDMGWGEMVRRGKYVEGRFDDALVEACVSLVAEWAPSPVPRWVTSLPSSRHPELVPELANRLAERLGLPFRRAIVKTACNAPQKKMENSTMQARNLDGVFTIDDSQCLAGPVILVDDLVDSRWTFTVAGALLRQAGCPAVFPLALADSSRT